MIAMTREAMHSRSDNLEPIKKRMAHSRAAALSLCEALSLEPAGYQSIPFLWAKIEGRRASSALASLLFRRSRILVTPGIAFGDAGEGYVQFSLTADPDAYTFAKERIQKKLSILKLVERQ
jgi:LL-diaminopimelate aminotransferase